MKIALITDIHFCIRNGSLYFAERYRLFFENIFFPYIDKHNIKTILCLGDTFEDRKNLNILGLKAAREMFFDEALKRDVKIISILGNHDVFFRNTNETNSMDIIESSYENVYIVKEYEEFKFGNKIFGLMSWINAENLERNLERIKSTSKADILLMHAEITGFEMTKGNVADKGLSQELFKKYLHVLSGHFHIKNKIGNIYYIGNPFQTNWDDFDSDRGFHIYDPDSDIFTFIKNTYNNYNVLIYTNDVDVNTFDYSVYEGQIVKILVNKVSELDQSKYFKFLDNLGEVAHQYNIVEVGKEEIDAPDIIDFKSNTEVINEYVDELNLEDDMKKKILDIMIDLHNVALSMSEKE